jgi:hypothetical protein
LFYANNDAGSGNCFDMFANNIVAAGYDDKGSNYVSWSNGGNNGNAPLAGAANSATLSLASVSSVNAGQYDSVVYNDYGIVISSAASLTVNALPSAGNTNYSRATNLPLKIPIADLISLSTNADGSTSALQSVSVSTNGANVSISGAFVFYTNSVTPNVDDAFTYTVMNTNSGCTGSGLVLVHASAAQIGQTNATISTTTTNVTISYFGVPGYVYIAQRSTNIADVQGWVNISTNTAPAGGIFQVIDDFHDLQIVVPPIPTPAFYRLMYP